MHLGDGERLGHGPQRGELKAPRARLEADVGAVELAHDARHGPALAVGLAQAGAAELLARRVIPDGLQRRIVQEAVQKRRVRRIDAHLEGLQPIAVPQALEGKHMGIGRHPTVQPRQRWGRAPLLPQPRKQHPAALDDRVAALSLPVAQRAAQRLCRRLQTAAGGVELPAMEGTAHAIPLVPGKGQIGIAVRAVPIQQAPAPEVVAEQNHVLPQHAHGLQRALGHAGIMGNAPPAHTTWQI